MQNIYAKRQGLEGHDYLKTKDLLAVPFDKDCKREMQINNSLQKLMKQRKSSDKIYQRPRSTYSQPARLYGIAKYLKR